MRLFFASWPPAAAARALYEWASAVHRDAGGRLTAEENIHLTLAFLGEAEPEPALRAARSVRARRHALPIDAARYWKHNKIVWVGPAQIPAALTRLVEPLHAALAAEGFTLEARPFAAHITLLRKARPPRAIPPLLAVQWPVDDFALVRSSTGPAGSRYETLERFPLIA